MGRKLWILCLMNYLIRMISRLYLTTPLFWPSINIGQNHLLTLFFRADCSSAFSHMAIYPGGIWREIWGWFELDNKGALCRTQAKQAKKNRIINGLTVFFGLFSGKLSAAGSGMAAQARQEVFIKWSNITKPKSLTILLRGGWIETIALFCTTENYSQIQQEVILKTTH